MKKVFVALLTITMLFGIFTGCKPYGDDRILPVGGSQGNSERKVVVGFAQTGSGESDWRDANTISVKQACEEAGFDLRYVDCKGEQENQIKALENFVTQGVDVIVIAPLVESGWDDVIKKINDAGIPLILMDRKMDIEGTDYYVTWMGSDFLEEGRKAGKWLLEYMDGADRGNDSINIVELQGTVGSSPMLDRQRGFAEVIAERSNFKVIMSETADWGEDLGKEVMADFLSRGERIDVLFAHNDNMAVGAIEAIKEAGLKPGEDIIIIGVDAIRKAFEAMIAGEMNCTVECSPLLGPQLVVNINSIMSGKTIEKITYTLESVYTQEVAADLIGERTY